MTRACIARRTTGLMTAAALAALVCGGGALALSHAQAATINVTIKDTGIQVAGGASAGSVTLVVRNAGKAAHQLVVLKTNSPPRALPMSGTKARETGVVGKTAKIPGGAVKKLTLTLASGKYILLSNLPGDYKRGLAAGFALSGSVAVSPGQQSTVDVSAFEMGFKLSTATVPHGTVTFKVRNDGKVPHDFRIGGKGTEELEPGQSETLTVDLSKPGQFTFLCTLSGHAGAGMIGQFTAK